MFWKQLVKLQQINMFWKKSLPEDTGRLCKPHGDDSGKQTSRLISKQNFETHSPRADYVSHMATTVANKQLVSFQNKLLKPTVSQARHVSSHAQGSCTNQLIRDLTKRHVFNSSRRPTIYLMSLRFQEPKVQICKTSCI